jgi:hypothetical protein
MEDLQTKVEAVLEKLKASEIPEPCNDTQAGFNIAIDCCISHLEHALGKTVVCTFPELIEKLKS